MNFSGRLSVPQAVLLRPSLAGTQQPCGGGGDLTPFLEPRGRKGELLAVGAQEASSFHPIFTFQDLLPPAASRSPPLYKSPFPSFAAYRTIRFILENAVTYIRICFCEPERRPEGRPRGHQLPGLIRTDLGPLLGLGLCWLPAPYQPGLRHSLGLFGKNERGQAFVQYTCARAHTWQAFLRALCRPRTRAMAQSEKSKSTQSHRTPHTLSADATVSIQGHPVPEKPTFKFRRFPNSPPKTCATPN